MARNAVLLLAFVLFALAPEPAVADSESCWGLVFDAIRHSAAAPVPALTSYNERGVFTEDGITRIRESYDVAYRSDGLAIISDPALQSPRATNYLEPGPPLIGPYGAARVAWLGTIDGQLSYPLVANVRNRPTQPCENLGLETYNGAPAYHIVLPEASLNGPTLRAIWLDPATLDIRKTIVGGALWSGEKRAAAYPNFEVEFQHIDRYTVVRHVTWKYRMRVYSQYTTLFGEYYFGSYSFSSRDTLNL